MSLGVVASSYVEAGGGGGATALADDFTAADGTAITGRATPTGGAIWATTAPAPTITANRMLGGGAGSAAHIDLADPDGTLGFRITQIRQGMRIHFREVDENNHYAIVAGTFSALSVVRRSSGVETTVGSIGSSTSGLVRVLMDGGAIQVLQDATTRLSFTDSDLTAATVAGFTFPDTSGSIDDFTYSGNLPIADDFTGVNGTIDGRVTPVGGKTWTVTSGAVVIASNTASTTSAGGAATLPLGAVDGELSILKTLYQPNAGIRFRYQDANNYLVLKMGSSNRAQVYRAVGGVETLLSNSGGIFPNGVTARIVMAGTTVQCYVGTTLFYTFTGETFPAATTCGLVFPSGTPGQWDDLVFTPA